MVFVEFSVTTTTNQDEAVYVVGDHGNLGYWQCANAIKLSQSDDRWDVTVELCGTGPIEYRYFIGKTFTALVASDSYSDGADDYQIASHVIVQRWEGGLEPRTLTPDGTDAVKVEDSFGTIGGHSVLSPGWLSHQTEVRLHLPSNAFVTVGRRRSQYHGYRVKCTPVDLSQEHLESDEVGETPATTMDDILYQDLSSESTQFTSQPTHGVPVTTDSLITFKTQTLDLHNLAMRVSVYGASQPVDDEPNLLGHALVLTANLHDHSCGTLKLPIVGVDHKTQGNIKLEYLVIRPLPSHHDALAPSTVLSWQHKHEIVDVGHRGMGKCRATHVAPYYKENTLQSFHQAATHGIEYVEFDVQLTKDKVPVVFHDFNCRLPCTGLNGSEDSWHDVPVMTMTYKQLINIQIGFTTETGTTEKVVADLVPDGHQLFPTLIEVLDHVHPNLGFNMEVKYPQKMMDGKLEDDLQAPQDMNEFVDVILQTLMVHAGVRNIVLSSFHPDICAMLRLKQNRFPVSFITQCTAERYDQYQDARTYSLPKALHLAKAEHYLGVNPISEFVLNDLDIVRSARDLDLVLMCWGSENTDKDVVRRLKEAHIHAVIFDHVDEMTDSHKYGRYPTASDGTET